MFDYTSEGLKRSQYDAAVRQLYFINKNLKNISRTLTFVTLVGVGVTLYKLKGLKYVEGE